MKLNEVNVGDCIRITYGKQFVKEGTVITKLSNGIVIQTDVKHQIFFPKEFFTKNVNMDILQEHADEVLVEEIIKINPSEAYEAFEKIENGVKILINGSVGILDYQTYGHLAWKDPSRSYVKAYMHWKDFDENTEVSVIREVTDI